MDTPCAHGVVIGTLESSYLLVSLAKFVSCHGSVAIKQQAHIICEMLHILLDQYIIICVLRSSNNYTCMYKHAKPYKYVCCTVLLQFSNCILAQASIGTPSFNLNVHIRLSRNVLCCCFKTVGKYGLYFRSWHQVTGMALVLSFLPVLP